MSGISPQSLYRTGFNMPLIRCTKKLLTEMGAAVSSATGPVDNALLGDWYANLLRIEGKKSVIFTSERTLLTFLVPGPSRDAIRKLPTAFQDGLCKLLKSEAFADDIVARLLSEYQELAVAATADRSVLGSLNDLARLAEAYVQYDSGLQSCDLQEINLRLNETPMSRLQMASPIAVTRSLVCGEVSMSARRKPASNRSEKPRQGKLGEVRITRDGGNKPEVADPRAGE